MTGHAKLVHHLPDGLLHGATIQHGKKARHMGLDRSSYADATDADRKRIAWALDAGAKVPNIQPPVEETPITGEENT